MFSKEDIRRQTPVGTLREMIDACRISNSRNDQQIIRHAQSIAALAASTQDNHRVMRECQEAIIRLQPERAVTDGDAAEGHRTATRLVPDETTGGVRYATAAENADIVRRMDRANGRCPDTDENGVILAASSGCSGKHADRVIVDEHGLNRMPLRPGEPERQ